MSNNLNFVLASPNDAADKIDDMEARIEALEAALREAVPCLEDSGYLPQAKIARAALAPEQDK